MGGAGELGKASHSHILYLRLCMYSVLYHIYSTPITRGMLVIAQLRYRMYPTLSLQKRANKE